VHAGEPEAAPAEADEAAPGEGEAEAEASALASVRGLEAQSDAEGKPAAPVETSALPWKLRVGIVAQTRDRKRTDFPWIKRWAPERLMTEIGVFGGMFFPAGNHDFYNPDSGHKPLWIVNGEAGLRVAFFPERYIGIELEGAGIPARVRTSTNDLSMLWAARAHVIAQLPWWSVTPFVLVGAGAMGVSSHPVILGKDVDPSVYWGGGVKIYLNRWVGLRVEGRHVLAAKQATQRSFTSHGEFLAGLVFTLGRANVVEAPPPNPDRDGDGFLNERDSCPDVSGVSPDGCPPRDSDKDGFVDTEDACPYEVGVEPDGCPIRDRDKDGIPDGPDKCIDRPETDNGFEDQDGCPDEIPEKMREFNGIIQGIEFEFDSAAIRDVSKPILDRAIEVLEEYPDIRIEIVGHTDSQGTEEHNLELSKNRAEAVKDYLVAGGIDESRLETRGAGESEPIIKDESPEAQARNRRTEFKNIKTKRAKP
jgi:outer membrane protein OmpA-like peptidoglycan-associated protein